MRWMVALRAWAGLALRPTVVRRGLGYAVVVGSILIAINHGDAILAGDVDGGRAMKMAITVAVPYVVSTLSSVGALRNAPRAAAEATEGAQDEV